MATETHPTGPFYRPELDALRFFAFSCVFLEHEMRAWVPESITKGSTLVSAAVLVRDTGGFGLCLFFLLSAYLITELLLREKARTGSVHLRAFYTRRILRIWPLYFGMLGFGYLFSFVRPDAVWGTGRLISYLFLVGNFYTARYGQASNPAGALWSISVEEQFYLLWPSISRRGAKYIAIASVALIAASWVAIYWLVRTGSSIGLAVWVNSLVQFQFFGAGALIALWFHGRMPILGSWIRLAMLLGAICSWLAGSVVFDALGVRGGDAPWKIVAGYIAVAVGCSSLCIGVLGAPAHWFPKVIVYLGKISYGLYVFHLLALRVSFSIVLHAFARLGVSRTGNLPLACSQIFLAFIVTVLLAYLSYTFFETPFLRLKERFTFVRSRTI